MSWVIAHLRPAPSERVGAIFGLGVDAANRYGFSIVLPWFEPAGDPIAVAANLVLGVSAGGVYKMLPRLQYLQPDGATNDR